MSKLPFFKIVSPLIIKKWEWSIFVITIRILIVFPCLVEAFPFFAGQNKHEHINGMSVFIESFSQNIIGDSVNRTMGFGVGNQKGKFVGEGFSEYGVLPIKLLPLNHFHAGFISKTRTQGSTAKTSDDSSNSTNNSDTFSGHENISLQWVIGYIFLLIILMLLSWGGGLLLFYFLTQRKAKPERRLALLSVLTICWGNIIIRISLQCLDNAGMQLLNPLQFFCKL